MPGLGVLGIVAGVGVAYHHAGRLSSTLRALQAKNQKLEQGSRELQGQVSVMQEEYTRLQAAYQTLGADRDNLIAQTRLSREEIDRTKGERSVLERVLKQTFRQERELKGRAKLLEQQRQQLQAQQDTLVKERDRLQGELDRAQQQVAKAQKDSRVKQEQQLRKSLSKERQEHKQAVSALGRAQKRVEESQARQRKTDDELASLQGQWESLQDRYAGLLGENTALKRQTKTVPPQVSRLAQQHQRLLKDTADMHYNLGVLFSKEKQFPRAAVEFRKVVELRPEDAEAHYNLGVLYSEHLSDREKALPYFRRYLQLSPGAKDANWVKQYIASWQAWEAKERLE